MESSDAASALKPIAWVYSTMDSILASEAVDPGSTPGGPTMQIHQWLLRTDRRERADHLASISPTSQFLACATLVTLSGRA